MPIEPAALSTRRHAHVHEHPAIAELRRGPPAMKPTVELSMIVKDGAAVLARCLRSAAPFVDRILVGDAGAHRIDHVYAYNYVLGGHQTRQWQKKSQRSQNRRHHASLCPNPAHR